MTQSRQVKRAEARKRLKDFRKHENEIVGKKNVGQRTRFSFLNRAGYRKFISNRCPDGYKKAVLEAEAA